MTLVLVAPLTAPHRYHLVEAGLLPTKAVSPMELCTMIELLGPECKLVLIMGDLNTCTTVFVLSIEDQVSHVSMDPVLNMHGHALLSLMMQQGLLMLSGMIQLSHQATSLAGSTPECTQLAVDYAIAFHTSAPLGYRCNCG